MTYPAVLARRALFVLVISLFAHLALPPNPAIAAPKTGWPQDHSDLKPDPKLHFGTLKNGMRYILMHNETPKGELSIRLRMNVGSLSEHKDERGYAHFIEHMAFNGTKNMPEGQFVKTIERLGIAFGADANAYTNFDETVFQLDLPNLKKETLDTSFMIMREIAGNVLFEKGAVDRERGVVMSEYRLDQSVSSTAGRKETEFLVPGSRASKRFPIGTAAALKAATPAKLKALYHAFYRPENALLIVVGDMPVDAMKARVEKTFADWKASAPARDTAYMKEVPYKANAKPEVKMMVAEGLGNAIGISQVAPYKREPDNRATRLNAFMRNVALSIVNRRLDQRRTEGGAGMLSTGASYYHLYQAADVAGVTAGMEPALWQKALTTLVEEYRRAYQYGFTKAEIHEALLNEETAARHAIDAEAKMKNATIARSLVQDFGEDWVAIDARANLALVHEAEKALTPAKLLEAFRGIWGTGAPKLFVTGGKDFKATPADIRAAYDKAATMAVAAPKEEAETKFAYTHFGTPGKIKSERKILGGKATEIRFENNVMLTLMPTKFDKASVYGTLRFGGGLAAMDAKDGAARFLFDNAFAVGGLKAHDRNALMRLLAGKTAGLSSSTHGIAYQFSAGFRPEDMLLQMQLWAAYLTAPGYREEAVRWFRRGLPGYYEQMTSTASNVAYAQGANMFYGKDYRFVMPPLKTLESVDMGDVKALIDKARTHSAIEMTLVGDFDEKAAIDAVARTLGALPKRAAEPAYLAHSISIPAQAPEQETLYHKGPADQATLRLSWPTDDNTDIKRTAALNLLSDVLESRLRDKVREDMGAAYAPGVSHSASSFLKGFGLFIVQTDARPKDVGTLEGIIEKLAEHVGTISADEMKRARAPVLAAHHAALETNRYWLGRLLLAQSDPQTLTYSDRYYAALKALTPADLEKVAAEYLKKDEVSVLKVLPEAKTVEAKAKAGTQPKRPDAG
ncbi:M16 family metallopeptidase [Kordiimonas marina]|uniref:M16 family metallopeptidase n=1 Tax=Kordiimonas marina TaxID=2872312 RepID=UPI001FF3AAFD|nr:M16 family metallopeptidase [Kordiimonas marina]MCJ9428650.1 insulinase family protein [Kordiimonas marina]